MSNNWYTFILVSSWIYLLNIITLHTNRDFANN